MRDTISIVASIILAAIIIVGVSYIGIQVYDIQAQSVRQTNITAQEAAYRDGIIEGCTQMFLAIAGPPPSDSKLVMLIEACVSLADRIEAGTMPPIATPEAPPAPTLIPGSTL